MTINTKKFFDEKDSVKDTRFTPSMLDRQYTTTTGSLKKGNFEISSRMMGDQEVKDRLSKTYADMGMKMEGGGYLPNVGKKYVDTAAGIAGGIKSLNKDGNPLDQVLSASGMNRNDAAFAINSQIEGTDAHYLQQVANSINLSADLARGKTTTVIQPVINNVEVPTPVPQPTPVPIKGKTNTVFLDASNNNTLAKLIR